MVLNKKDDIDFSNEINSLESVIDLISNAIVRLELNRVKSKNNLNNSSSSNISSIFDSENNPVYISNNLVSSTLNNSLNNIPNACNYSKVDITGLMRIVEQIREKLKNKTED
jgi:hypothetical protein